MVGVAQRCYRCIVGVQLTQCWPTGRTAVVSEMRYGSDMCVPVMQPCRVGEALVVH